MTTARTRANRKYNDKTYERIPFVVRMGEKDIITAAAERAKQSVNAFIKTAVDEKIEKQQENKPEA